jgi:hypothetical protein
MTSNHPIEIDCNEVILTVAFRIQHELYEIS